MLMADRFVFSHKLTNAMKTFEIKVNNVQIDSYSEGSCTPVLVFSEKSVVKHSKKVENDENPFFHLSIAQNRSNSAIPKYKHLAILILEFHVCLDTSTILIFLGKYSPFFIIFY